MSGDSPDPRDFPALWRKIDKAHQEMRDMLSKPGVAGALRDQMVGELAAWLEQMEAEEPGCLERMAREDGKDLDQWLADELGPQGPEAYGMMLPTRGPSDKTPRKSV